MNAEDFMTDERAAPQPTACDWCGREREHGHICAGAGMHVELLRMGVPRGTYIPDIILKAYDKDILPPAIFEKKWGIL